MKEKQRDLSRKGGKFNESYNESTYTVVEIKKNGNCVIKSNKSGDILATPCPLKHLKKFFKQPFGDESDDSMEDSTASGLEDSAASSPVVDLTIRPPDKWLKSDDTKPVNSPLTNTDHNPSISTVTNENKTKKKLDFSDGTTLTSSLSVSTADGTAGNTAAANIKLVETLLNTSTCNVLEVSSDDKFNVICLGTSGSHDWPFNPITESSREELGLLVQITKFGSYPNDVTGGRCKQGKILVRERIRGDGNCYFCCISFILSGAEDFYPEVRKAICDFIEVFDRDLSPFLNEGEGKKYI